MVVGDHRRQCPPMYIERLSFGELRLVTNALPVIRPLILLTLLCFKKKMTRAQCLFVSLLGHYNIDANIVTLITDQNWVFITMVIHIWRSDNLNCPFTSLGLHIKWVCFFRNFSSFTISRAHQWDYRSLCKPLSFRFPDIHGAKHFCVPCLLTKPFFGDPSIFCPGCNCLKISSFRLHTLY